MTVSAERVVLVGGHESDDGAALDRLTRSEPTWTATTTGRPLASAVETALSAGESVTVVPMTFGRDPVLVADTAKTLAWIRDRRGGPLRLTAPFGTTDHLIAHLRSAAIRLQRRAPGSALVIAARSSDSFNNAELHRCAYLVGAESTTPEIAVALGTGTPSLAATAERLRRLGFGASGVVPAGFQTDLDLPPGTPAHAMSWCGPLIGDAAARRIITERVASARHDWQHGTDGIDSALNADHDHGYAHSHGDTAPGHGHTHTHGHGHGHSHHPTPAGKERHGLPQTAV
ncbi:hypothetical protein ATK17_3686 [Branchiibius hedensis]|uniref:Sirohydrochlorin ferrochelatase n=1 Tax=Branchiibius hedensis TaxID=672460 RepID=A0A2Y8ZW34_9MICO|nr:cobalamin biosynthesis protein CbiX [Branchiibius hedensis]PWJ27484.1 hypothetical protein ATK17_3686 [Branchiibius hedensis]SSA36294.1 hypothetical protein SAMN04489750_3686 [Branchiibius hedensis]